MPIMTRSRKRHRTTDDQDDINSNNKKKRKAESDGNNEDQLIKLSEYFCCVCKDLSGCKIYQCPNGCIICENCYAHIIPCKCPLCRAEMNKNKPIRCRIAERTLALRLVTCRYDGCNQQITFEKLKEHEMHECEYKPIDCKYHMLGCRWKGLRQQQKRHESHCEVDKDKSLKLVQRLDDKLKFYQSFCNRCSEIIRFSVYVPSEREFETGGQEICVDNYEYKIKVKSIKKNIKRSEQIYEMYLKIVFVDGTDGWEIDDSQKFECGIIIEPHGIGASNFVKEMNVNFDAEMDETEWLQFPQFLSKEEYAAMFKGGFDIKVFCFGED